MEQVINKCILIVDDDDDFRRLLSRILRKQGYKIIEAGNGEIGLDKLRMESPDMVMVDVEMPGINGFEFCEQACRLDSAQHIPILIMTAQDDHESVNRAYERGATDFITKPINQTKLVHRIRFALKTSDMAIKLANRERQLISAQKTAKMGEWTYDINNKLFIYSEEVKKIFGLSKKEEIKYDELIKYVLDDDVDRVGAALSNPSLEDKGYSLEFSIKTGEGEIKRIRQVMDININKPVKDGKLFGIFQDITELRNAEKQIKTLSLYDSLTGLPNRQFFKRLLSKTIASARRQRKQLALLKINIDNFMRINANLGHDIGDQVLNEISQRLTNITRGSDLLSSEYTNTSVSPGMLAHMGSDKFIILLNDIKVSEDAVMVVNRIIDVLNENFIVCGNEIHLSISIGIGIYPDDGEDSDDLLMKASSALDNAKELGPNKHSYSFYSQSLNAKSFQRLTIENNLKKALPKDQFLLYYQPKISLINSQITGAEALIRWNHPEMGMVSPVEFIPVAENTGLIGPITDWVIAEACRQLGDWRSQGLDLPSIAINMAPSTLLNKKIHEHIFKHMRLANVDASKLDFEITESTLMEDIDIILPILEELRSIGSSISIDDFGTGYSSLSYLKRLPISKLKIDQSFIRELMQNKDDSIIVNTVISLAHNLGMKVIAEGVEDYQQLEYLRERGCDVVQGYYYSRPLPANEFYQWCLIHEKKISKSEPISMVG